MAKSDTTSRQKRNKPARSSGGVYRACTNRACKLRKAGCKGFEGCPGYRG